MTDSATAVENDLREEGRIFGRYLLGVAPSGEALTLYVAAITQLMGSDNGNDTLVGFARRHPWSLPYLDGALALRDASAPLRRRLIVMFAILESQPEIADRFMAFKHRPGDVVRVIFSGLRAVCAAAFGIALLPFALRR